MKLYFKVLLYSLLLVVLTISSFNSPLLPEIQDSKTETASLAIEDLPDFLKDNLDSYNERNFSSNDIPLFNTIYFVLLTDFISLNFTFYELVNGPPLV